MKKTSPMYIQAKDELDNVSNITRENLSGNRVVRAFNKQAHESEKFKNSNYNLINSQIKHGFWNSALTPLISIVVNLAIIVLFTVVMSLVKGENFFQSLSFLFTFTISSKEYGLDLTKQIIVFVDGSVVTGVTMDSAMKF